MKQLIIIIIYTVILVPVTYAYYLAEPTQLRSGANINARLNQPNTFYINRSPNVPHRKPIYTPPPPPPVRYSIKFKDSDNSQTFPTRSYYVPSYCIPERAFYNNIYNPFCNHYLPYGNNIYISF